MKFLEKELIFVTQEKFYQVQLSQKQKIDYESYQLVLKLVDKKFLRSFSLKKILLGYPYVKLFSSVVPTPDKKEYQNLADFFLPKEILRASIQTTCNTLIWLVFKLFLFCLFFLLDKTLLLKQRKN